MFKKLIVNRRSKAFTLVEILVVISILSILFIVLLSSVTFSVNKSRAAGIQSDFRAFETALSQVSKEHQGFYTFGYDTGDLNNNRKEDQGEQWTGVYTLKNNTDPNDRSSLDALAAAINKHLSPELQIVINDDLTINMKNDAKDPWKSEYHGYIISNAELDKLDRGAVVMYSNGTDKEFGSAHSVQNGIVEIATESDNLFGVDDYSMATVYSYQSGVGEVLSITSGFSNNQVINNLSQDPIKEGYRMTSGKIMNVNFVGSIVLVSNADYDKFVGLRIDGQDVSSDNYTIKSGSTIVTLKGEFVSTLKNGSHKAEIVSTDGIAKCQIVLNIQHTMVNVGTEDVHSKCTTCGYTVSEHTPKRASTEDACTKCACGYTDNTHNIQVSNILKQATCINKGITKYKCSSCAYSYEKEDIDINPSKHTGELLPVGTASVCYAYECCGKSADVSHSVVVNKAAEKYLIKSATCIEKASYYKSCKCGYTDKVATFEYGRLNSKNHTGSQTFAGTAKIHTQYDCCGIVISSNHSYTESVLVAPTCNVKGATKYTCGCGYSYAKQNIPIDKSLCADLDMNNACDVCNSKMSYSEYAMTCEHNTYILGTNMPLTFTSDAEYSSFMGVKINGSIVDCSNYTVSEGSTIVSLNGEYLESLSEKQYTIMIYSKDGIATGTFIMRDPDNAGKVYILEVDNACMKAVLSEDGALHTFIYYENEIVEYGFFPHGYIRIEDCVMYETETNTPIGFISQDYLHVISSDQIFPLKAIDISLPERSVYNQVYSCKKDGESMSFVFYENQTVSLFYNDIYLGRQENVTIDETAGMVFVDGSPFGLICPDYFVYPVADLYVCKPQNIPTWTIPEGGTYYEGVTSTTTGDYTGVTAIYNSGECAPAWAKQGDVFVYGNYEYRYYHVDDSWEVKCITNTSNPGKILSSINDKPVTRMNYTFYGCTSLTEAPVIPNSVTNMYCTFYRCTSLEGEITIHADPNFYTGCFGFVDMSKVTLTGSSTKLNEIGATGSNWTSIE